MKPLIISTGEPAGIGPDICLSVNLTQIPAVLLGDMDLLLARKEQLGLSGKLTSYQGEDCEEMTSSQIYVIHQAVAKMPIAGKPDPINSPYVLNLIDKGVQLCQANKMRALVTAPVNKAIINQAGIPFSGHTEYLAQLCGVEKVVMMLACDKMRVALATTHLPVSEISKAVTREELKKIIAIIHQSLQQHFAIAEPKIVIAGLNPHAGEQGYLGREEIEIIEPVIRTLQQANTNLVGPVPADTMFCTSDYEDADVYLAMYHDQGLPVVKYAGFHQTANITLGLPIIRTSVDHGTALTLAGKGIASPDSIGYACKYAWQLVHTTNNEDVYHD